MWAAFDWSRRRLRLGGHCFEFLVKGAPASAATPANDLEKAKGATAVTKQQEHDNCALAQSVGKQQGSLL